MNFELLADSAASCIN